MLSLFFLLCNSISSALHFTYQKLINRFLYRYAQQINSKYYSDRRSRAWFKIKNILSDDFIIVGFTAPQGSRSHLGALVIAESDDGKLIPRGSVGTGFNEQTLKDLHSKLSKIIRKTSALKVPVDVVGEVTWPRCSRA